MKFMHDCLAYYKRDKLVHREIIMRDCFFDNLMYDDVSFRRQFRMWRSLLLKVIEAICGFDSYFIQRNDAIDTLTFQVSKKTLLLFVWSSFLWSSFLCNRWIYKKNKKHSHEEYEMVCKGYSYHFWKPILKTTYTHIFWINKWQSTKHLRSW